MRAETGVNQERHGGPDMDDVTDYEAMRSAGATPSEVFVAARQQTNYLRALLVLRKVFGLSLADAWYVAKQTPELSALHDMSEFWSVIAIDRRARAPVVVSETVQPPDVLYALMARLPDICRPDLISWGHVTRTELDALIRSDYLVLDDDELAQHPPEHTMWSIFIEKR